MSPEQEDLERATWDVSLVDAEVKLYLLALVRTSDEAEARRLSGLDETGESSARGWLRQVGLLREDGSIDRARLQSARHERLRIAAA